MSEAEVQINPKVQSLWNRYTEKVLAKWEFLPLCDAHPLAFKEVVLPMITRLAVAERMADAEKRHWRSPTRTHWQALHDAGEAYRATQDGGES